MVFNPWTSLGQNRKHGQGSAACDTHLLHPLAPGGATAGALPFTTATTSKGSSPGQGENNYFFKDKTHIVHFQSLEDPPVSSWHPLSAGQSLLPGAGVGSEGEVLPRLLFCVCAIHHLQNHTRKLFTNTAVGFRRYLLKYKNLTSLLHRSRQEIPLSNKNRRRDAARQN